MIRTRSVFDPVERTAAMRTDEFSKYVDINSASIGATDEKVVEDIRNIFFSSHSDIDVALLDDIWGIIGPKIIKNPGLAQFTLDYNGAGSDYFFPWLISVFTSPSKALEMAYGAGADLCGVWDLQILDSNDPIVPFVRNDPTFVYNRERQLHVADLATIISEQNHSYTKVVDYGAGRLAWARWHGYDPREKAWQAIYAFDSDLSIDPGELFGVNKETLESECNIHFKHGNLAEELVNPNCSNANLVVLGGVASYIPIEVFSERIIPAIYQLLIKNGVFFFDYQLDCPYLRRSMSIFDWPKMELFSSSTIAIETVESVRKKLWNNGIKFSAEYTLDTYNQHPSSVMITLQKV
ncbi:MAG: hypothetical protein Q4A36_02170 [Candidatus Saccharibacteria bacterium]|nr:hypothetical protein [Candidatus Saccharibacteria bacterium]